jgi:hypothetical protein
MKSGLTTSAKCVYCNKTVSMEAGIMSEHRAVSGMRPGGKEHISSMDRFRVGDWVKVKNYAPGTVGQVTAVRPNTGTNNNLTLKIYYNGQEMSEMYVNEAQVEPSGRGGNEIVWK